MVKWFNASYRRSVAETTEETRWYSVKKHILSYFGNISMDKITTQMLDEFYNDKLDEGLSPKSVKELHHPLFKMKQPSG